MSKVNTYNLQGKKIGTVNLPPEVFDIKANPELIHQALVAQLSSQRQSLAHVKDRSEKRGGGRKPWRQKGTGRARHGSIRSPIWRGGGVTFGPRKDRKLKKKINKKMKRKALLMCLSSKAEHKELIVLDNLELEKPKTKLMAEIFKNILKKGEKSSLVIAPSDKKKNQNLIKANQNIPYSKTIPVDSLNVLDLLSFKYLILSKEVIKVIKQIYGSDK